MNSPLVQSTINRALYAWRRVPPKPKSICRLLYDHECGIKRGNGKYPYLWRFYGAKIGYPMTVLLHGEGNVSLEEQWQAWFYYNNTPRAVAYTKGQGARPNTGWVNTVPWPMVRQIACPGDGMHHTYLVVDSIEGNRAYIESYDNSKQPSDYPYDYLNPFGIGYPDGKVGAAPCGLCYTFAIHNPGERLWVDVQDLTFFKSL